MGKGNDGLCSHTLLAAYQDMVRTAVLIVDSNKPQAPPGWNGDLPGGHHRNGAFRFQPSSASPQIVELLIARAGGIKRTFRWRLIKWLEGKSVMPSRTPYL